MSDETRCWRCAGFPMSTVMCEACYAWLCQWLEHQGIPALTREDRQEGETDALSD